MKQKFIVLILVLSLHTVLISTCHLSKKIYEVFNSAALWGGNSVAASAGVKFVVNRFYSIISLVLGAGGSYVFDTGASIRDGQLKPQV